MSNVPKSKGSRRDRGEKLYFLVIFSALNTEHLFVYLLILQPVKAERDGTGRVGQIQIQIYSPSSLQRAPRHSREPGCCKKGSFTGVSDPGAFKLDHLQPVKMILSKKTFHLSTFHTGGSHFLLPQRERKRGSSWGRKRESPKNE